MVHGLCEAWIAHFRRVCGSRPSFGKWDWGGSARPMWFVGRPQVNCRTVALKVPGLSHHFSFCYACRFPASAEDEGCRACGVSFRVSLDRDRMGLGGDGAQTSAFGDTANVRSMPQQSVSPSEDAVAESSVPTEEPHASNINPAST